MNVALFVWAKSSPILWDYYRGCDLLVPDGMGIYYASRLLGDPTPEVTNAVFIMYELLNRATQNGYRVYLLGTAEPILRRAIARLRDRYPGLQIVGSHHGFFSVDDEDDLVRQVRAAKPDVLLIGISSLRKEEFLRRNLDRLGVAACFGVGGAFDVVAGAYRLAPHWVRVAGFEWIYRLVQEPGRLWKRYLITNTVFGWLLFTELLRRAARPTGLTRR